MDGYTEYGYRGLEEIKKLQSEISELKKQIADENIKVAELTCELNELRDRMPNNY